MRASGFKRSAFAALFAAGALLSCAASAGGVVDRAEIRVADQYADVEIKFNVPITIGAYAPSTHGELLQINVELPIDSEPRNIAQLGATEWMAGSQPSAFTLYEYLRFDRSREPHRGRLVIKFVRDVDFTVYKSADSRAIVISILRARLPKSRPEKLPGQSTLLPETVRAQPAAVPAPTPAAAPNAAESVADMQVIAPLATAPIDLAASNAASAPASVDAEGARPFTAIADYSPPPPVVTVAQPPAPPADAATPLKRERTPAKNQGWRLSGGFSQHYSYSDIKISRSGDPRFNSSETQTSQNDLRSYLNLNARYRDNDWDVRSRFNGGYRVDFRDYPDDSFRSRSAGNHALLSDAYVDVRHRASDMSAKVGRQYGSAGGVFGRFDGAQLGVPIGAGWRANVIAGSPVDLVYNKTVDDTNSYFYGANVDFAPSQSRWQTNLYALEETIDGVIGRRALGNETRYFGEHSTLLTLLDYDIEFGAPNRALAIGSWTPLASTTLNATLDYGYNPLLTLRNALISQPDYRSIKALRRDYDAAQIEQLARDRTAKYRQLLLSATHQLDVQAQLYASVGHYAYGEMRASGNVAATPATGAEYDYTLQYIRTQLFQQNDTHVFGVRYYDGRSVQRQAAGIDARYLWQRWQFSPRLWIERRYNLGDDSSEWLYRPGVRVEYTFARRYHLEFDASSDIYRGEIPEAGNEDVVGNFVQLGYRIDFD